MQDNAFPVASFPEPILQQRGYSGNNQPVQLNTFVPEETNEQEDYKMHSSYRQDYRQDYREDMGGSDHHIKKDAATSLKNFSIFTTVCISLGILGCLLALAVLGWVGICICFVLLTCVFAFFFALHLFRWIMDKRENNDDMQKVARAIRQGADGYLQTQYTVIGIMTGITSIVLFIIFLLRGTPPSHTEGSFCSGLAGYCGVWISVRTNIRVAVSALTAVQKQSKSEPTLIAFRGGAVAAILSAAMCILGITLLYLFSYLILVSMLGYSPNVIPLTLAGYGFGASFVALFMQLGGGIYTKAADVGADMCGKIEKNIPEDDPRNPAVIADLVGDNVGDCAGSMADVFESIAAEIIGTMILANMLARDAELDASTNIYFIFFPLMIHTIDLIVSSIGIISFSGKAKGSEDPLALMKKSYLYCTFTAIVCFFITARICLYTEIAPSAWFYFSLCGVTGILTAYLLILSTQYYTDYAYDPVQRIAEASKTGDGTNVIMGISVGMESCGPPILVISAALFTSYTLGYFSGLSPHSAGVFGTACATMGMLCTAVFILSMNNFGPIADNAGGIVEMSGQSESVRSITDQLDAVGNVTKAASKGYAVGGSALACFVLFQAFLDEMAEYDPTRVRNTANQGLHVINLARLEVIIAGLLGIMLVFVFTGFSIAAVGKTAEKVVWEVRRQFDTIPGIMTGEGTPDYNRCVRIVTQNALKEMIKPASLALLTPIILGVLFSKIGQYKNQPFLVIEVLAGFLLFTTLVALVMAIFLDNAGGAWDNAKKLLEARQQKGTIAHKAAVTGDTVGDPFKDTAGPALHVIITTISTTILVLGPLFIGGTDVTSSS